MPTYLLVALLTASFVLPTIVALGVAVYSYGVYRWFFGAVGLMAAIGFNAGLAYYSYTIHPEWWSNDDWPLGAVYFPYLIANLFGVIGSINVAEKIDRGVQQSRRSNVRPFRRSA